MINLEPCSYAPGEPKPDRPDAQEMAWLQEQAKSLNAIIAALAARYPYIDTPNEIEGAISDGESMADWIDRRVKALDIYGSEA